MNEDGHHKVFLTGNEQIVSPPSSGFVQCEIKYLFFSIVLPHGKGAVSLQNLLLFIATNVYKVIVVAEGYEWGPCPAARERLFSPSLQSGKWQAWKYDPRNHYVRCRPQRTFWYPSFCIGPVQEQFRAALS